MLHNFIREVRQYTEINSLNYIHVHQFFLQTKDKSPKTPAPLQTHDKLALSTVSPVKDLSTRTFDGLQQLPQSLMLFFLCL